MKKLTKGFTLIELLVVIAIIGILSSVVLASLNTARDKGSNAAAKANLTQMRASAELQSNDGTDYSSICTSGVSAAQLDAAAEAVGDATPACFDETDAWAASIELKNGEGDFCVDSTGQVGTTTPTTTVCP